ncbi:ATP-binding cassette domain-containing protein [Xinfangfangia sp. CPCC 101601]|uniref:ATP-binding cassette domain-containing protein n=1 Tax=Pseudogemmobacter lacusdianii TaxID=3069608 RepID=A0ABU0W342_9RHOB|nr:ATP-binding cassette domain-containing protein [Xinfangfangia sp. CPCC 101601]MDQ2067870.1 ATP-binding cassette domain-containing protein [Xinfangfangia sp. CPCC 101601]
MINATGLMKSFGKTPVINDVSVSLAAGGITSIVGPNGAGKSTLLALISRLMRADAGTVTVDGLDVWTTPASVLARRLSILRQDNHMTARLSVRDLVAFGRYPHSQGRLTLEDKAHVERALDYMALNDLQHRFLDELSGGQRQRAFVAMVLCQDTDYLLLDEPLNNLDMKHAASMMKLLRRVSVELGKTIVLVLHDINFAGYYSDQIVAMRDGRVLRQGPPAEVITSEVLREVYDMEIQVREIDGKPLALFYE